MKIIKRIALTVLASAISIVLLSSCLKSEINEAMNDAEVYISTDETLDLCIYNIDTLNPLKTSAKQNAEVLSLLYDSLFIVSSGFTAIPSLCESFSVSKDGLVCTAKIKNGVYFQNKKKLTASDVVYSLNTILDSDGYYKKRLQMVKSAKVYGNFVKFYLSHPTSNFNTLLDFPVIPENCDVKDDEFLTSVIPGSGIYKVCEYIKNKHIALCVNDEHHSGTMPLVERINIHIAKDKKTALSMLENSQLDILSADDSYIPKRELSFVDYNSLKFLYLGMNTNESPINSAKIRSEIFSKLDAPYIIKKAGVNGQVAKVPLHPESHLNSDISFRGSSNALSEFKDSDNNGILEKNVGKTKHELSYDLIVSKENPSKTYIAALIKETLLTQGIKIRVRELSFEEYKSRISAGKYDMFLAETTLLPNFDFNDLLYISHNSNNKTFDDSKDYSKLLSEYQKDASVLGLCFKNDTLLVDKKITFDKITTLNPYLSITDLNTIS